MKKKYAVTLKAIIIAAYFSCIIDNATEEIDLSLSPCSRLFESAAGIMIILSNKITIHADYYRASFAGNI